MLLIHPAGRSMRSNMKSEHENPVAGERHCLRLLAYAVLFFTLLNGPTVLAQERTPKQGKVIKLTLPTPSGSVTGQIIRYSTLLFTVQTDEGQRHRVLWNAIPADKVNCYWRYLEEPEGDALGLFELGDLLTRHRDGEPLAEQAFAQALALDKGLADAIEQSRSGKAADGTPRYVGTADPAMWGELSEQVMQQGVETLRDFAKRTQRELNLRLNLYESDRLMLLTDVGQEQVAALSIKLAQAYESLSVLMGQDPRGNVFVGKCLVVLFDQRVDYIRFQDQLHDTDARGTGGLCHGFGTGHAHIAAFKRGNPRQTNHILIHELAHAYLHRFQGPRPLDDWVGEGLAEYIAHRIEPTPGQNIFLKARLELEGKEGLGQGFFEGENLAAWQYDVAGALTSYLLERSETAYPHLITELKRGTPADKALQTVYRMTPTKLVQRFKRRLDRELGKKLGG